MANNIFSGTFESDSMYEISKKSITFSGEFEPYTPPKPKPKEEPVVPKKTSIIDRVLDSFETPAEPVTPAAPVGNEITGFGENKIDIQQPKAITYSAPQVTSEDSIREHYWKQGEDNPSLVERAASFIAGRPIRTELSPTARAQADVIFGAMKAGVPLHEYRNSPEVIEQAASALVNSTTFGLASVLKEKLAGEIDFPATSTAGMVSSGLVGFAGTIMGPWSAAKSVLGPILNRLPRAAATQTMAVRTIRAALSEATILGGAGAMSSTGVALGQVSFSDAAKEIGKGTLSGAITGGIFGVTKGLFPNDPQRFYRIITGLLSLNAQRVIEHGPDEYLNRPFSDVAFDTVMDVFFLWNGLPAKDFAKLEQDVFSRIMKGGVDVTAMPEAPLEHLAKFEKEMADARIKAGMTLAAKGENEQAGKSIAKDKDHSLFINLTKGDEIEEGINTTGTKLLYGNPTVGENKHRIKIGEGKFAGKSFTVPGNITPDELAFAYGERVKRLEALERMKEKHKQKPVQKVTVNADWRGKIYPVKRTQLFDGLHDWTEELFGMLSYKSSVPIHLDFKAMPSHKGGEVVIHGIGNVTTKYVININANHKAGKIAESLAHEAGHVFHHEVVMKMPANDRAAIEQAYKDWVKSHRGDTYHEAWISKFPVFKFFHLDRAIKKEGQSPDNRIISLIKTPTLSEMEDYRLSYVEWFADEFSKWAMTNKVPQSASDRYFSTLAKGLKKLYNSAIAQPFYPNKSFNEFMRDYFAATRPDLGVAVDEWVNPKRTGEKPKPIDVEVGVAPPEVKTEPKKKKVKAEKPVTKLKKKGEKKEAKKPEKPAEPEAPVEPTAPAPETPPNIPGSSEFFQDKKTAEQQDIIYSNPEMQARLSKNPDTHFRMLINQVNVWYHGKDLDIESLRAGLRDLATADYRGYFGGVREERDFRESASLASEWAAKLRRPGKTETRILESSEKEPGAKKPKSNIPDEEKIRRLAKAKDKLAGEFSGYVELSRQEKKPTLRKIVGKTVANARRNWVDKSSNLRSMLVKEWNNEGLELIKHAVFAKGANAVSVAHYRQMHKEVFKGLSREGKSDMHKLVLAMRIRQIYETKRGKTFNYPRIKKSDGTKVVADPIRAMFFMEKMKEKYGDSFAEMEARANTYFDWMKKALKALYDNQLISEKDYNNMKDLNYERLQRIEMFEPRHAKELGKKGIKPKDRGVENLSAGRKSDILETDAEILALDVFNRTYHRVATNRANLALRDFILKNPDNGFAVLAGQKDALGKTIKAPANWDKIHVYVDGKKESIFINELMSSEWILAEPELTSQWANFVRTWSGNNLLRLFATGINPGFAIANLPRDFIHVLASSQIYKDGKWVGTYNSTLPIGALQLGADIIRVSADAALKKGRWVDYIENYGGFEFLSQQGRTVHRLKEQKSPDTALRTIGNFLGWMGETSEAMTRLAIMERVIKLRAKERGISMDEARKDKWIVQDATFAARDYFDFAQGGGYAKAVDTALPYFNASIQATRGLWRSIGQNPKEAAWKIAQLGMIYTGLKLVNQTLAQKTYESIPDEIKDRNFVICMSDELGFEDPDGQWRGVYFTIPLDPSQTFFKVVFEGGVDILMGREVDPLKTIAKLKNFSPVDTPQGIIPPTANAIINYFANKDLWTLSDVWKGGEPLSFPQSKTEFRGMTSEKRRKFGIPVHEGDTPQALIDTGQVTGLSPARLNKAIEQFTSSHNIYTSAAGYAYNKLVADVPDDTRNIPVTMQLADGNVIGRFVRLTHPYPKYHQMITEAQDKSVAMRTGHNTELEAIVDARNEGSIDDDVVREWFSEIKEPEELDRLMGKYVYERVISKLPEKSFWRRLSRLNTDARAEAFVNRLEEADKEERAQIREELGYVGAAGGILSDEFWGQVGIIQQQRGRKISLE